MPEAINLDDCLSSTACLFGQRLKQRRQELRLTQTQIFEQTGMARSYLSMVENGRANPTLDMIEKLARVVGLEAWAMLRPDQP
jgi:transcriptional regulator with XRE-family HTH domain